MELRRTEECLDEVVGWYESLRQSPIWMTLLEQQACPLPPFPTTTSTATTTTTTTTPTTTVEDSPPSTNTTDNTNPPATSISTNGMSTGSNMTADPTNTSLDASMQESSQPHRELLPILNLATAVQTLQQIQMALRGMSATADTTGSSSSSSAHLHHPNKNDPQHHHRHKDQYQYHLLPQRIEKFRKRLVETDPITNQPRYGIQTFKRVEHVLTTYDFLVEHVLGTEEGNVNDNVDMATTTNTDPTLTGPPPSTNIFSELLNRYQKQRIQEEEEQKRLEREQGQQEETIRLEMSRKQQEEERLQQELENEERRRHEEEVIELARQAEIIRQNRQTQERIQQEWFESIPKGVDGVRQHLLTLKESTTIVQGTSPDAYRIAVTALYTLFQQINAHPEETKFRRIRRDHEQFQTDIGQYKGGIELLIAAGFVLGTIDDVPCYLSKEPNIEKDMDGWSTWFDILKGTLQVLEEEVMKIGGIGRR